MNLQDRFVKIMLAAIVVLLALNLLKSNGGRQTLSFESIAHAQIQKKVGDTFKVYDVKPIRGYEVTDLKEVVSLGDGKTFVVYNGNKFMVYQLDSTDLPPR